MRLGTTLPQFGDAADEATRIGDFAARAEEAGAASLWVGDRLLAAVDPQIGYGGADTIPVEFRRALDAAACDAGREPAAVATALRVNVAAGTGVAAIADGVRRLVERTGFTDVFVDPMYVAPGVDATLELFADVLHRTS